MYVPMNVSHSDTVYVVDLRGDSLATKLLVEGYNNNTSLFVHKDRLFVGTRDSLYCFTLDDPLHPQRRWAFGGIKGGSASFHHLKIVGDYAYISDNNADGSVIAVISLKDIDNPVLVKKIKIKGVSPRSLAIDGGYLYVADRNAPYIEVYRIGSTEKVPSLNVSQFQADEINSKIVQTTDIIAEETVTDTIKTKGIITPKFWMHGGKPLDKDDNPGFFNANYVSIHAGLNTPPYGSPFFVSGGKKPWDYYFLVQTSNTPTKGGALLVKTNQSSGSGWQVEIDSAYSQQSTSWPVWAFWVRGVKWDQNGNFGGHYRVHNRPLFGWGTWSPLELYVKLWDTGDWQWIKYPNTRDDGGAPTSIVSTDANGYVKLHPVEYNRGTTATITDGGASASASNVKWHYTRVGNEVTYLLSFDIAGTGTQKVYEVTLPFDATNTLILDQMQASAVNVNTLSPLGVLIDDSDGDKKPNITVNIPSGNTGRIDIEVHYRAN
ncbi:MAG: hypothetical protein D6694_15430 [Gammaproteobacteria bacterium]|nr:MAG: hypothetical protein D6694_15430 [Gammaproteobacteria bacterium]